MLHFSSEGPIISLMAAKQAKKAGVQDKAQAGEPKFPYVVTPAVLRRILETIPEKPKPVKVILNTLKGWGVTSSNDSSPLRVLKAIGLIGSTGEPTAQYVAFMKKDTGPNALGQLIQSTYPELFQNVLHPENATNDELKRFFNIHSGGAESTIKLQVDTFKALAAYATFGAADPLAAGEDPGTDVSGSLDRGGQPSGNTAIRIDLHIHLPENKTKADYDAILESIANHIYRRPK